MPFKVEKQTKCDVLIIGGGGAGLRAAIAAAYAKADVLMVSKARMGYANNTYLSKGIVAASGWGDPKDGPDVHGEDTRAGGRYLNNPGMVARFAEKIYSETRQLIEWGAEFNADEKGIPTVMKIPGHTHARHLFGKHWKGSDLILPLRRKAEQMGVRFREHSFVTSLVLSGGRVAGATALSSDNAFLSVEAKTVVLATGGFGQVFLNTNNAPGITGDGQALAYEAGVDLQDMEFVQFYPTALGKRGSRLFLYERILVQEGVCLKNGVGDDILKKNGYQMPNEISRDQLAQVMMKESLEAPGQPIFMDMEGLPQQTATELAALLPPAYFEGKRVFPVVPTTHFCMGGVVVDKACETSCPGLFAAGEVCAGAHGANRLGGNALAEVIAMGSLAGEAAAQKAKAIDPIDPIDQAGGFSRLVQEEKNRLEHLFSDQGRPPTDQIRVLKEIMWENAGILRDRQSLEKALALLEKQEGKTSRINTPGDLIRFLEFRSMRLMGEMICRSALKRTESRGSHFRNDFPRENDQDWLKNIRVGKKGSVMGLNQVRVPDPD